MNASIVVILALAALVLGPHLAIPAQKIFLVLFRNSICPTAEAWQGLNEHIRTGEAMKRAAVKSRLRETDGQLQKWDTPMGVVWFPRSAADWTIHFALAQFELGAYPRLDIHPGDVVLDGGAYVGEWARWALLSGASKVITIEPAAEHVECIRRNLGEEINQGLIVVCPIGLWDGAGRLHLGGAGSNPAARGIGPGGESIEVTTIDNLVAELNLNRVDVIKMDIEGAEVRAIHGAKKTLNRFRPRLAIATEHTQDMLQNNRDVIRALHEVAPFYQMRCGYCASVAGTLTPETLYFSP